MDKFESLPTPQKALIFFLIVAAVAGAFYFLLIADAEASFSGSKAKVQQMEKKAATLAKYGNNELFDALEAEEEELKEQLAANKALLPEAEQIPSLITSIKRQADERGLKILKFDKKDRMPDDYVDIIPVKMEVEGPFPVVVSFFEALSQPGMRMMTVESLELSAMAVKKQMDTRDPDAGTSNIRHRKSVGGKTRGGEVSKTGGDGANSPVQQLLARLDAYGKVVENMKITARFTVNAYSYSGQILSPEERQRSSKSKRRKKRSRR